MRDSRLFAFRGVVIIMTFLAVINHVVSFEWPQCHPEQRMLAAKIQFLNLQQSRKVFYANQSRRIDD